MSIQISDTPPRVQHLAGAGQTPFNIPFVYYSETDVKAYLRAAGSTPNDAVDILAYPADYSLTPPGVAAGGTLTLNAGATLNAIFTAVRDQPEDRDNLYVAGGALTADALNDDFSKVVLMNQQNELLAKGLSPRYDYNAVINDDNDLLMDVLPAGNAWRKNAAGTKIEAFLPTSATIPVTESLMAMEITQATHGLIAGNVVRIDNTGAYLVSQADSVANAEVVGYVNAVADVNTFTLQTGGNITAGLAGLTAGSVYYLSPTVAGALTATSPTAAGQVIKPILQAASATTGIWLNYLGVLI